MSAKIQRALSDAGWESIGDIQGYSHYAKGAHEIAHRLNSDGSHYFKHFNDLTNSNNLEFGGDSQQEDDILHHITSTSGHDVSGGKMKAPKNVNEAAESLVSSMSVGAALDIESSFKEVLSQKVLSAIEDRRPEVLDSMFDTEGNYQRESFTPDEEDPQRRKANYGYPYGWNNQSGDNFLNGQEPEEDEEEEEDEEGGGDEGFDGGGAMSEAANWPRKAHSIHSDIEDAGYTYQRTNGKFHVYENPDGDQIRHSFPTLNGNHSFAHYDLNGHPLFKSSNTGDTDIKEHLKKVKKPSHGSPADPPVDPRVKDPRMGVRESSGWKEEKDAGSSGWLERRHKAADASGNVWKYEDARGVEKHGYLSGYSDFGGTDHIQWMRDHKTGQLDLVSGSRLKAANIVPRSKKAELLGLKVESCISESQTYGTPGCKGCENDTYNGVCMDCTRARAKSATTRGGCKCGSKKVPSTVKSNGLGRSWISCDRCLGQIKQLS